MLEVHYLGRLPFYGDRVRKVIERIVAPDAVTIGRVPANRDDLNALLRTLRRSRSPRQLLICPLAPSSMLPEVLPAAVSLGIGSIELLSRFRDKSGSQEVPVLCPLAGRAFSDPRAELAALQSAGIENAMVALAPNLIGAADVIRDPAFRIERGDAERALRDLIDGALKGIPPVAMIDQVRRGAASARAAVA